MSPRARSGKVDTGFPKRSCSNKNMERDDDSHSALMDRADVQSRSRAARRRHHHRRALHATDAADPPRGIGRPDQQGAAGDDRGRLRAVILACGAGAERDHPRLRFRSQRAAQRGCGPARRLWTLDDLAGAVRVGCRAASAASPAAALPQSQSVLGGFVLGTTLGLVWTPCAGPVLGSILTVIATSKDTAWASTLLVVYAIGARSRCC